MCLKYKFPDDLNVELIPASVALKTETGKYCIPIFSEIGKTMTSFIRTA
jgi:hypothetical protein